MLPDKIEHCIVFMNYWDVSGVFWSFSKCKIKIPHLPADPSSTAYGVRLLHIMINDMNEESQFASAIRLPLSACIYQYSTTRCT